MGTFDLDLVNRFTEGVIAHGEEILLPTERTRSRRHFSEARWRMTLQVNTPGETSVAHGEVERGGL